MLLTGVRSAILGMLIIGTWPLLATRRNPVKIFLLCASVLIMMTASVYMLLLFMPQKVDYLFYRLLSSSTSGRIDIWINALRCCLDSPLMGQGMGSAATAKNEMGFMFHNSYLMIWYNTGIFGLLSVILFLIVYSYRAFRLIYRAHSEDLIQFSQVAFGYMLALTAIGFFEGIFAGSSGIGIFMLLVATTLIDKLKTFVEHEKISLEHEIYSNNSLPMENQQAQFNPGVI